MNYYLSVDIGASSGRLILSHLEKGKILLEEIHRFENGMEKQDGHLTWNTEKLFAEIISGMKKCSVLGKIPKSIGIDTWAVDYVLLDQAGNKLLPAITENSILTLPVCPLLTLPAKFTKSQELRPQDGPAMPKVLM